LIALIVIDSAVNAFLKNGLCNGDREQRETHP